VKYRLFITERQGLALHGYDPVAYVRLGKALQGRHQLDAAYGGVTFYFATDSNRALFQKDPKAYLPAYGGWSAYGMAKGDYVDADPENFKLINGQAHLFYRGFWGDHRKKWEKNEAKHKADADLHWQKMNEARPR
jgi:YHS domain-containing protein